MVGGSPGVINVFTKGSTSFASTVFFLPGCILVFALLSSFASALGFGTVREMSTVNGVNFGSGKRLLWRSAFLKGFLVMCVIFEPEISTAFSGGMWSLEISVSLWVLPFSPPGDPPGLMFFGGTTYVPPAFSSSPFVLTSA